MLGSCRTDTNTDKKLWGGSKRCGKRDKDRLHSAASGCAGCPGGSGIEGPGH